MGLFGKKKPWDYNTNLEKMNSIKHDYPRDVKVLRKVLLEEPNIDLKTYALMFLLDCDNVEPNGEGLIKYMSDLGVPPSDAAEILLTIVKHLD